MNPGLNAPRGQKDARQQRDGMILPAQPIRDRCLTTSDCRKSLPKARLPPGFPRR
jgi:hypothetical protein